MSTKGNSSFSKLASKYAKRLETGERENNVIDVREDLEQYEKLQEIVDLLVAAGYFRARIKNLSSFDKVVGGMVWCIEFCNAEVDVNLLFQENLTIGQKISLTEKIVAVLPQIQCPYPIEPHQIQGLDFIHIFPVIQWLVKRSMEFRKDASDSCYSFAVSQFEKNFSECQDLTEKQKQIIQNIKNIDEFYKPRRVLKRKNAIPFKDITSKVQITLLEYEHKGVSKRNENDIADENSGRIEEEVCVMQQDIDQLLENIDVSAEESFDYDNLPDKDREKISEHYRNLRKEFGVASEIDEKNKLSTFLNFKESVLHKLEQSESYKKELKENIEKMSNSLTKIKLEQGELKEAIKLLESEEKYSEKAKEVEKLLLQGDNLDKQKSEFEENCQKESELLKSSIESLEERSTTVAATCEELDPRLHEEEEKLNALRLQLAKKNRALSVLLRKIDEVPSRSELAQYQKRFIELYNQISAKHKETKQYYSLYNTLEDTRQYLRKELSLLNSVIDNYPETMRSKECREEFIQQFENIREGVHHSRMILEKRLAQEKRQRDDLNDNLHGHLEMNRKYAAAIKELKTEFQKNEEIARNNT